MKEMRWKTLTMASLTQENLENAIRGLFERSEEKCNDAIADDDDVDRLQLSKQPEVAECALIAPVYELATSLYRDSIKSSSRGTGQSA